MDPEKRQIRKLKRDVKKAGAKKRRQFLKRTLEENPEAAHEAEFEFGRDTSTTFNGMDQDATRRPREEDKQDEK